MNAVRRKARAPPTPPPASRPPPPPAPAARAAAGAWRRWRCIGADRGGNWWLVEGRWIESTDNAYVQGDIAVLSPRIEGDVAAIHVADNQAVRAGDPLISLDPADWQARLDQARGAAAEAVAAVATARRQMEQSRAAIAQADAMIAQAEAELTRAAAEAGRSRRAGRRRLDLAAGQRPGGRRPPQGRGAAARRRRRSATPPSRRWRWPRRRWCRPRRARVTAEAAVRLAANNLSYTVIRAPFDGIVGNRAAQLGQHVAARPAAHRAWRRRRPRLFVVANFKETQLRRMRPGQKVRLTPDIDSGAAVDGRVDSLAPATGALFSLLPPENATGNFTKVVQRVPVKIVIDPADGRARALAARRPVGDRRGRHARAGRGAARPVRRRRRRALGLR